MKTISIIIPAYNEEENIPIMVDTIKEVFIDLPYRYDLIFINDGSTDQTQEILHDFATKDANIFYINFSRNFGHQAALKAGIDFSRGDCVISLDCDMQHPPQLIKEMLLKWEEGYDIVYTRRENDNKIPFLKRVTSRMFYKLTNKLANIELEDGTADFRLINRNVANILSSISESDLFIRGMIKWLGFKQYAIDYQPAERYSGVTKYTFRRMISLALKGITSFSVSPLYTAMYVGIAMSILSLLYLPYVLYAYHTGHTMAGWGSILLTIVFFGGIQLIMIGLLGIYIGKLFVQSKNRPNYIVRTTNLK